MSFTGCATADSQWLFIALGEHGEPASMTVCADNDALLAAIKETMFYTGDGEPLSEEHAAEALAIMESLIEEGDHRFEGDPGFHLYRVWKSREQAIADVCGVHSPEGEKR
jgi:hypothetical protein